jgi:hypothetical protein
LVASSIILFSEFISELLEGMIVTAVIYIMALIVEVAREVIEFFLVTA